MCGRFVMALSATEVKTAFAIKHVPELTPHYNSAPTQLIWAIRQTINTRELVQLRWGFIPPWLKQADFGSQWINARAETLAEKPLFREAFKNKRCLIIASGFYEWQHSASVKQPYYITSQKNQPIAMAGLWSTWENKSKEVIESCTIITTEANPLVKAIHGRMPVILAKENFAEWLDPSNHDVERLQKLLSPYQDKDLVSYSISKNVNNPANDTPELIKKSHDS